jgi:hypothetical protein
MSDATYGDVAFKSGKTQTRFRFASEFNMHGNEEHNEGKKMEVDSVVAMELRPIELEVAYGTRIFSNVANGFGEPKGTILVLASMHV